MLANEVKDWISQSKNNLYISNINDNSYSIRTVNNTNYQHHISKEEALYVQIHQEYTKPSLKNLVVFGTTAEDTNFSYIQKIAKTSNEDFLYKKNIEAEAVSHNGYNFILLSSI